MAIPQILNSKIYDAISVGQRMQSEFTNIGFRKKIQKNELIREIIDFADKGNNIRKPSDIVTKRGKFTAQGIECLKNLMKKFDLGITANWDDLFAKALAAKKVEYNIK